MRDDFSKQTKELIAARAGYLCSNPECKRPTRGAASCHDGYVNVGVAAHITAASAGGPRYDPNLSTGERQGPLNAIWLCQTHAKLIDSDSKHFTVEELRKWKQVAERQSFLAIVTLPKPGDYPIASADINMGRTEREHLESLTSLLIKAAQSDLATFKRMSGWPHPAIALNLKITDGNSARAFNASALASAIETFNNIVVIAPPGTGKTTTLLQLAEAILAKGHSVSIFVPLNEWSSQTDSFFHFILSRHAFGGVREEHLNLLANNGRLVLVMDGWNELDGASRQRARHEIRALQRNFPALGIIISTRRQVLDIPISGTKVEIEALTMDQQLEIARALRGPQGEAILDQAWRTSGVRELVSIPLYLTVLLSHTGTVLPKTKEEILCLFITEHEHQIDHAEALNGVIFGFQKQVLTALAVYATEAGNTVIIDTRARAVVKSIEEYLSREGQISTLPQPITILDVLVDHHLLTRSAADTGELSFQHQQFQEWYASFEVGSLMCAVAASDQKAKERLRVEVLNVPAWEESILFTCERLSRTDNSGVLAVSAAVVEALAIDPMLAAEMIYRSSSEVWVNVKERVLAFVGKWHLSGKVDRAVHFMISTGRSEFAPQIWPLISNPNDQVHLAALRAGRRFRPSVLGADIQGQISQLPEDVREHVLSGIASESGMDGIELAVKLARADSSQKVQVSVIEALLFRRAYRSAGEILTSAPDDVWRSLAVKGYTKEISDPDITARLHRELHRHIEEETDVLKKLGLCLDGPHPGTDLGTMIGELIESEDFPLRAENAGLVINEAHKQYPTKVASALIHRLEAGLEIPSHTEDILEAADIIIDDGPLVKLLMRDDISEKVAKVAVRIVGSQTVGKLIDKMVAIDVKLKELKEPGDGPLHQQYRRLSDWISNTRLTSFAEAVLGRSSTNDPREIVFLADLVGRHENEDLEGPLQLSGHLYEQMVSALRCWAESILSAPTATRAQLAKVAQAIGQLAAPQLVPMLEKLLAEDLVRWRRAREEATSARAKGLPISQDAYTSWTLQYRRAFAAIDDQEVVELIKTYLPDFGYTGFGLDAANVLKDIYDKRKDPPKGQRLIFSPDFSEVRIKRLDRQDTSKVQNSSVFADAIIAVVNDLIQPGAGEAAHRHAVQLAKIAFSMPYGNRTDVINTLLQLPLPLAEKRDLLTVLVLAGEIIQADIVVDGIKALLEHAKTEHWLLNQNSWELEAWLILLPFSDRPKAVLDALELVPNLRQPWKLRSLLTALGQAPSPEAEEILILLARKDWRFLCEYSWLSALDNRGSMQSACVLLELICEIPFATGSVKLDSWTFGRKLAAAMQTSADVRSQAYQKYESVPVGPAKAILKHAIAEAADTDGVMLLVKSYLLQGRPFDHTLYSAIKHVAVGERSSANWVGSYEVFSVPNPELRKRLFAMINGDTADSRLAIACLNAIDELRDDYGAADEPRHPDITTGCPWPLAAGLI